MSTPSDLSPSASGRLLPPPPTPTNPSGTYHRRHLPPPGIAFASHEGRKLFTEAISHGYMNAYFPLAEHFHTQAYPTFCGLGSLTMALNTLFVDPHRIWQGVWRWFDDAMLVPGTDALEVVKKNGVNVARLCEIAQANGACVTVHYGDTTPIETFREDVKRVCSQPPEHFLEESCEDDSETCEDFTQRKHKAVVLLVSYSRQSLNQTGVGHFSPIAGYHAERDMVLIMDVARFKYPPHWVPLQTMYEAMQPIDEDSGRSRGYMLLSATDELYKQA